MARINQARFIAHRDGIKIIDKKPGVCYLRGYNVSESIEVDKFDVIIYHFDENRSAWIVDDFETNFETLADARTSARDHLRVVL